MILKNVEVRYVRVHPERPDKSLVKTGAWTLQIFTRNKDQAKEWRDLNIKVKMNEDDEGIFYTSNLSKNCIKADGVTKADPVEVVNGDLVALDPGSIDNGTICNIRTYQYETTFEGIKHIKTLPQALQITKHVVYKNTAGPREEFEKAETETIEPVEMPDDNDEDDAF